MSASPVSSASSSPSLPPHPALRVLIVDNFDSFTHNLAHACGILARTRPIVKFNSESEDEIQHIIETQHIDAVIVSPGPGAPSVEADFGCCAALYSAQRFRALPILGVCLGLQGQYVAAGGRIVPALHPMHGRLSAIAHDNRGLFRGLPQGFKAVRYNSLVAQITEPLPGGIEISAWAECEGTSGKREVMGMRAVADDDDAAAATVVRVPPAPRESVQFHPESICTEQGQQLLRNFFDMVIEHKRAREAAGEKVHWCEPDAEFAPNAAAAASPASSIPSAAGLSARAASPYALLCHRLPFFLSSELAFSTLHPATAAAPASHAAATSSPSPPSSFWLDSSKVEHGRSRFSYMGDNAGPLAYSMSYSTLEPLALWITRRQAAPTKGVDPVSVERVSLTQGEDIWGQLQRRVCERDCSVHMLLDLSAPSASLPLPPASTSVLPFNFESGLVGYIGYAMRKLCTPPSLRPIHLHFESQASPAAATADAVSASAAPTASESNSPSFRPPDLAFLFADRLVVFDHQEQHVYLLCLAEKDPESLAAVERGKEWMRNTAERLEAAAKAADAAGSSSSAASALASSTAASSSLDSASAADACSTLSSRWFHSEAAYLSAIGHCLDAIRAGESYEICLTNQLDVTVESTRDIPRATTVGEGATAECCIDPFDFYRILRRVNPAAYAALFRLQFADFPCGGAAPGGVSHCPSNASGSSWSICSSSPERFLQVDRARVAESKPIKGTAARGATPEEDQAIKVRLAASTKDFAENLMIVDLLRNDLGRVCKLGSIRVPKLMEVESYATVHNLVSTIQGQMLPGCSTVDLVRSAFPPGSMTGAPKMRTCQILAVLEEEPAAAASSSSAAAISSDPSSRVCGRERGIYSGCIGWIGINGGMTDLNVVIRTAIVTQTVRNAEDDATGEPAAADDASAARPAPPRQLHATHFRIGAGGAIVYLSDPHEEYAEVHLKTKALLHAIQLARQELAAQRSRKQA